MTPPDEVTVIGIDLWADRSEQLARFLATSPVTAIPEPSAVPAQMVNLALPEVWAQKARELTDAQAFASRGPGAPTVAPRTASGTVALIEERLGSASRRPPSCSASADPLRTKLYSAVRSRR